MILTDYYRFSKQAGQKSKLSLLCVKSTHSYNLFEERRARIDKKATQKRDAINVGDLRIYFSSVHDNIHATSSRRASVCISMSSHNLTSVYLPNLENPTKGYGDIQGTQDGVVIAANGDFTDIELFLARGVKNSIGNLFSLFIDGELDEELKRLRETATGDNPPQGKIFDIGSGYDCRE